MDKLQQLSNIRAEEVNISKITDFFETIKSVKNINIEGAENHIVKSMRIKQNQSKSTRIHRNH